MMRLPIGSVPPAGCCSRRVPLKKVFGTVSASTTRVHGISLRPAKYSVDGLDLLGRHLLGEPRHRPGTRPAARTGFEVGELPGEVGGGGAGKP